jgi:carbon-monoxide dehydrogenase iron sulfur subunit
MKKELIFVEKKCTGCRLCELMCVLEKEGACGQSPARLKLIETDTLEVYDAKICRQCDEPECQEVCPEEAINRNPSTGALEVDQELCTGCQLCLQACPYEAIFWDAGQQVALKCDLCGGEPVCVASCPKLALLLEPAPESDPSKK